MQWNFPAVFQKANPEREGKPVARQNVEEYVQGVDEVLSANHLRRPRSTFKKAKDSTDDVSKRMFSRTFIMFNRVLNNVVKAEKGSKEYIQEDLFLGRFLCCLTQFNIIHGRKITMGWTQYHWQDFLFQINLELVKQVTRWNS